MKIKYRLKYIILTVLLLAAALSFAPKQYYSAISRTFGISVAIKPGFVNCSIVAIQKANANNITIMPVTGIIEVYIPTNSFTENVSFTLETKTIVPAADKSTVKLSPIGISMTAVPALQPGKNLIVTIRYRDQDILGLDESKLAIGRYDEPSRQWLVLRSTVYADENKVTALTSHLSIYALIQNVPATDLSSIKVYPNPWYPSAVPQGVVIDGLTKTAEIRIYTIAGELVTVLNTAEGNGRIIWNGKNSEGGNVGSGIYIAVIKNGVEMKKFKIGVQR